MAKAPGKRGTTPMTGRKEEGEASQQVPSLWQEPEWPMVAAEVLAAAAAASLWRGAYRVS